MNDTRIYPAIWQTLGQIAEGEPLSLRVSGNCMDPHIKDQATVTIRNVGMYLPGDVLVVQRPSGSPVVHRLIGVFPTRGALRYITQADNSPTPDGSVTQGAIVGKVCGGQCSPFVVNVPLRHRAKALSRFLTYLASRLSQRTCSLLKDS